MIVEMGLQYYRFSISWPRLLPNGYKNEINAAGVNYYNNLIDELLSNGVEPLVTMFHWDLPWNIQQLGGWTNSIIIDLFVDYGRLLFDLYGDRVKIWTTINEPISLCYGGYGYVAAPGLNASGTADYMCGHNVLKAHAEVYHLYDKVYRKKQNGRIGALLNTRWYEPVDGNSIHDRFATIRALEFTVSVTHFPKNT